MYVVSAFRRTSQVRLKPDTTYASAGNGGDDQRGAHGELEREGTKRIDKNVAVGIGLTSLWARLAHDDGYLPLAR
jgi:hypothetical protein